MLCSMFSPFEYQTKCAIEQRCVCAMWLGNGQWRWLAKMWTKVATMQAATAVTKQQQHLAATRASTETTTLATTAATSTTTTAATTWATSATSTAAATWAQAATIASAIAAITFQLLETKVTNINNECENEYKWECECKWVLILVFVSIHYSNLAIVTCFVLLRALLVNTHSPKCICNCHCICISVCRWICICSCICIWSGSQHGQRILITIQQHSRVVEQRVESCVSHIDWYARLPSPALPFLPRLDSIRFDSLCNIFIEIETIYARN